MDPEPPLSPPLGQQEQKENPAPDNEGDDNASEAGSDCSSNCSAKTVISVAGSPSPPPKLEDEEPSVVADPARAEEEQSGPIAAAAAVLEEAPSGSEHIALIDADISFEELIKQFQRDLDEDLAAKKAQEEEILSRSGSSASGTDISSDELRQQFKRNLDADLGEKKAEEEEEEEILSRPEPRASGSDSDTHSPGPPMSRDISDTSSLHSGSFVQAIGTKSSSDEEEAGEQVTSPSEDSESEEFRDLNPVDFFIGIPFQAKDTSPRGPETDAPAEKGTTPLAPTIEQEGPAIEPVVEEEASSVAPLEEEAPPIAALVLEEEAPPIAALVLEEGIPPTPPATQKDAPAPVPLQKSPSLDPIPPFAEPEARAPGELETDEKEASEADEPMQWPSGFSLKSPPPDVVLQSAMECRTCRSILNPPALVRCDMGHLICGKCAAKACGPENSKEKDTKPKAVPTEKQQMQAKSSPSPSLASFRCPALVPTDDESEEGQTRTIACGAHIKPRAEQNIHKELYDGCSFICPRVDLGCLAKPLGASYARHLRECYYNSLIRCPNSYCPLSARDGLPLNAFITHLQMQHKIPLYNGPSHSIPIWQERLKRGEELQRAKGLDGTMGCKYEWIAAIIALDGEHFFLRVREEQQQIFFWVQQHRERPPPPSAEEDATKQSKKVYWSQFKIGATLQLSSLYSTQVYQKWRGLCAPPRLSSSATLEEEENFMLYKSCLESKYVRRERRGYSWEMQVVIQVEEVDGNE